MLKIWNILGIPAVPENTKLSLLFRGNLPGLPLYFSLFPAVSDLDLQLWSKRVHLFIALPWILPLNVNKLLIVLSVVLLSTSNVCSNFRFAADLQLSALSWGWTSGYILKFQYIPFSTFLRCQVSQVPSKGPQLGLVLFFPSCGAVSASTAPEHVHDAQSNG